MNKLHYIAENPRNLNTPTTAHNSEKTPSKAASLYKQIYTTFEIKF